jgi:serine phosphatase RsbU (regulator of sigma subunit)
VPDPGPTPTSGARRSDAVANVARILDAAEELLRRRPHVSIGEIAQYAGVGRSTLYRHFETREALVEAVRRRARDHAEHDHAPSLRPAGELANVAVTPLSVPDVLNKVAPFQLSEQIVAEAQRLDGTESAALYVADLAGIVLRKLAGAPAFPDELRIHGTIGTEIPREAYAPIRAAVTARLPGAVVTPLMLRGRAIGMLVVVGEENDSLRDLAREAAVALALADGYTDTLQTARRARPTSPAAEIQQNLLPARIHRLRGATLAGNVLPGYDVGGDWFDVADNADAVWLGIADVEGSGVHAAGLAAVLLGAFRSARHQGEDPAGAVALMHEVLLATGPEVTATTTIGCWNATTSVFRWVSTGSHGPLLAHADGRLEELDPGTGPRLGSAQLDPPFRLQHRRLDPGQRLVLLSDGGLESRDASGVPFGRDGVAAALRATRGATAAATVHAIERAICVRIHEHLEDDVTTVVLAPHTH